MKRKLLIPFLVVIMMIAATLGLSACDGCGDSEGITLSSTEITIEVGGTATVSATVSTDDTVTWTSENTNIATVSSLAQAAIVKGVAEGETTITATAGEYTATCKVTVTAATTYTIYNNGTVITGAEIEREGTLTLTATDNDGTAATYWASSDESVITVNNGTVTAVGIGTATLYAGKDSSHCASITITVTGKGGVEAYNLTEVDDENNINAVNNPGTWYYWTEWADITTKQYEGGEITLKFTNNAGNWYNIQLFYKNSELTAGTPYILKFNVNTTLGGRITVNGMVFTLTAGDNTVEAPYYETADGNSASIQLGVQKGTIIDIDAATMVFSDFTWTQTQAETLAAPSFTVTNNVISITDTNESYKVGSYKLYLYDASGNLAGAVDVEDGMNLDNLDTSAIEKGTYTAYLRALGFSSVYSDSANSTSSTTITVTSDASYTLTYNTEADAVTTPGTWFYWCEYWVEISNNTYSDGVVSLTFGNNAGNWYDTQLFYKSTSLTAGQAYKLTFTLNSTSAGTITINGTVVEITEGDNTIEVSYTESSSGASIAIIFGTTTGIDINSATVKLSNFNWEETTIELDSINNGGQTDATANRGYWFYWNDLNYVSSYTAVSEASYENGTVSITYTVTPWDGQSAPFYALQLFYENGNLTEGETYTLTLTITSTVAGSITVNGTVVALEANVAKEVTVTYTESSSASISIQMGTADANGGTATVIPGATITVSGVTFKDASGNVIDNGEGMGALEYEVTGSAIEASYTTLANDGEDISKNNAGTWYYWYVQDTSWNCGSVVTMSSATLENDTLTLTYSGGSETYSVQIFYTNTSLTSGNYYRLTCNVYASAACSVTINGKDYTLSVGNNEIKVDFTLGEISAFDMQLAGTSTETTIKVSDVAWYNLVEAGSGSDDSGSGDSGDSGSGDSGDSGSGTETPDLTNAVAVTLTDGSAYNDTYMQFTATSTYDISSASYVTVNGTKTTWTEYTSYTTNTYAFKVLVGDTTLSSYTFYWYDSTGTVVAYATYPESSGGSTTATVTAVAVTGSADTASVGDTLTLTATVTMSDSSTYSGDITWETSDQGIATVSNGVVTAVSAGTVTITAAAGGVSGTYTITVTAASGGDSGGSTEYTTLVDTLDDATTYAIPHDGESVAIPNAGTIYVWYIGDYEYWGSWTAVSNSDVTANYDNGTITWSTKNSFDSDYWWANQLFYKNTALSEGTEYMLTLTIVSDAAGNITVNGTVITLNAGTNNITVYYTESSSASLSIQLGVYDSATDLTAPSLTISNINWYAKDSSSGSGDSGSGDSGDSGSGTETPDLTNATVVSLAFVETYGGYYIYFTATSTYDITTTSYVTVNGTEAWKEYSSYNGSTCAFKVMVGDTTLSSYTFYWYDASDSVVAYATYPESSGGDSGDSGDSGSTTATVTSVTISGDNSAEEGGSITLTATIKMSDGTTSDTETVTWTSSNIAIATVSDGVVKALAAGTTYITATSTSNATVYAVHKITVTAEGGTVTVASVTISGDDSAEEGESITLTATVKMSDGTTSATETVTWTSSNTTVATVSDGVVTAIAEGTAIITATSTSNTSVYGTITITVTAASGGDSYTAMEFGGESVTTDGWMYWNDQWWCGSYVTVNEAKYIENTDGTYTVIYSITSAEYSSCTFGFQLFYNDNTNYTSGNLYILTATIVSDKDITVTFNDTSYTLTANVEQAIEAPFYYTGGVSLFDFQQSIAGEITASVTISNISWKEATAETLVAPSFTVDGDNVITITDTNDSNKVDGYKLYLYSGETFVGSITVTNGMDLDDLDTSTYSNGTYTAYLRAVGASVLYNESANSTTSTSIVVNAQTDSEGYYAMSNGGETSATNGWLYWNDQGWCGSTVTVGEAKYKENTDGTYTVTYTIASSTGACTFGFQLFYNDMVNYTIGKTYTLTATIISDTDTTISINGKDYTLTADTETAIEVEFTYSFDSTNSENAGTSLFDLVQNITDSLAANVTISNIKWEEVTSSTATVESVTISGDNSAEEGESITLTATVKMSDNSTYSGDITWETSDSGIATVSDGVVKAVSAGEVTITATADGVNGTITIYVTAASSGGSGTEAVTVTLVINSNYNSYYYMEFTATSTYDLTTASYVTVNDTTAQLYKSESNGNETYTIKVYVGDTNLESYVFNWYDASNNLVAKGTYTQEVTETDTPPVVTLTYTGDDSNVNMYFTAESSIDISDGNYNYIATNGTQYGSTCTKNEDGTYALSVYVADVTLSSYTFEWYLNGVIAVATYTPAS